MSARGAALVIAVLLLVPIALPFVQAQGGAASVETDVSIDVLKVKGEGSGRFTVPIPPKKTETFKVLINYTWAEGGWARERTEIELSIRQTPDWIRAEWSRSIVYAGVPADEWGGGGNTTVPVFLNVTATEDAPAFNLQPIFLNARALDNTDVGSGNLQGSSTETVPLISAGYLAQATITPAEGLIQIRGGETRMIAVDVQNTGNTNITAHVGAHDVPSSLRVTMPTNVTVATANTTTVDMVVTATDMLASNRGKFVLEAVPRAVDDPSVRGPRSEFEVVVDVRDLPSAVLLGQQTLTEVLIFSALFVGGAFVAGWPLTTWWENRRKEKGRTPGYDLPSLGTSEAGSASRGEPSAPKVYGVPKEGDDYEIVDDDAFFEEADEPGQAETADAGESEGAKDEPKARKARYELSDEDEDLELVGDDDLEDRWRPAED